MTLKTDYKEDILASGNTRRKYNMITNDDGTVSFEDVTEYEQTGDSFGATDVNQINEAVTALSGGYKIVNITIEKTTLVGWDYSKSMSMSVNVPVKADKCIPVPLGVMGPAFTYILDPGSVTGKNKIDLHIAYDTRLVNQALFRDVDECDYRVMLVWLKQI